MTSFSPEIIGAIAGFIGSVSLVPQVIHSFRTKSTEDLSYASQIVHLAGRAIDVAYMVLIGATAGWVTLAIEILFGLCLLALKIHLDGCGGSSRRLSNGEQSNEAKAMEGKEVRVDTTELIEHTCSSSDDDSEDYSDVVYDIENQISPSDMLSTTSF